MQIPCVRCYKHKSSHTCSFLPSFTVTLWSWWAVVVTAGLFPFSLSLINKMKSSHHYSLSHPTSKSLLHFPSLSLSTCCLPPSLPPLCVHWVKDDISMVITVYCQESFRNISLVSWRYTYKQRRLVRGATGEQAHCKGWSGINGMVPNTWK